MIQKRNLTFHILNASGWLTYSAFGYVMNYFFGPKSSISPGAVIKGYLMTALLGMFCTSLFRRYAHRKKWLQRSFTSLLPGLLCAILIISFILALSAIIPQWYFAPETIVPAYGSLGGGLIIMTLTFAWGVTPWMLIYFAVHYFERNRNSELERWKLEAALKETELQALKSQLNPHFLFNSLNGIRSLIAEDPGRAQHAITLLASTLRYTLLSGGNGTVSLREELDITEKYLQLEAIRFEERLSISIDADPKVLTAQLPPMILQTIAENAIKHGISNLPAGGRITIEAGLHEDMLRIRIINSGQLRPDAAGTGIGLKNSAKRLELLWGDTASIRLSKLDDAQVLTELILPFTGEIYESADN